jgi:hypothetical protein
MGEILLWREMDSDTLFKNELKLNIRLNFYSRLKFVAKLLTDFLNFKKQISSLNSTGKVS